MPECIRCTCMHKPTNPAKGKALQTLRITRKIPSSFLDIHQMLPKGQQDTYLYISTYIKVIFI